MNAFPLSTVRNSGFYWLRKTPEAAWQPVHILVERESIAFLGTPAETPFQPLRHQNYQLYGPIPIPSSSIPIDDEPTPF
jgi:hypothetical protein